MKYVVIVNGKPESGKTTFETGCKRYINDTELAWCHIVSSIDPVKDIYRKLGWDGNKTDKARKELSILKKIWMDNCNGPLTYIVNYVMNLEKDEDHVIFVDIREESEIEKIVEVFNALYMLNIKCTTVFINRPDNDGIEYGNKSDDMVGNNMSIYNHIINNDGGVDKLLGLSYKFIEDVIFEGRF